MRYLTSTTHTCWSGNSTTFRISDNHIRNNRPKPLNDKPTADAYSVQTVYKPLCTVKYNEVTNKIPKSSEKYSELSNYGRSVQLVQPLQKDCSSSTVGIQFLRILESDAGSLLIFFENDR